VYRTNPAWVVIGVALLALRYRRTDGTPRRQIRWLLFGIAASLSLWIPAGALWQLADPDSTAASAASELLSGLAEVTTLGSGPCSTPGYSVSTSPRGARSSTVSCGCRSASCSPSWRSWPG
jgi:hypothetical protein